MPLVITYAESAANADVTVKVVAGQLKGRPIASGGAVFKGVPFAQPPLGELRWREPAPLLPWTGVRDAGAFDAACTQQSRQFAKNNQEDCLYLNVWTPEWPPRSLKPVMVWIHGGGNTSGAGSEANLDGTPLSRRGVVVVTINYRLGVFGFFIHPGLSAESPHHVSGNYGLLDQIAALKWVHDNITKFGGDPTRVTAFGQSSGAIDTSILVASPLTKGLIQRSIQQSGPPLRVLGRLAGEERLGVQFATSLKAPSGNMEAVRFLRSLPSSELLKAYAPNGLVNDGPLLRPVIDDWLMPLYPALTYQEGRELPIPMIVGNNLREQDFNYNTEAMRLVIARNFGSLAPQAEEFYGLANGSSGNDDPLYGSTGPQITADTRHRCGAVAEALWRSSYGRTTYEFQFDAPVPGEPFTKHTAEIPFVFGTIVPGAQGAVLSEAEKKISADIQQYWVNFAITGNPNGSGLPQWPKFDTGARPFMEFTSHDGPVAREGLRRNICDLYIAALKETIPSNTAAFKP
jgi:para-nitrobenzyl esterase